MSPSPDVFSRQQAVLSKLNNCAISSASEYFAHNHMFGNSVLPADRRRAQFAELFPHAEYLEFAGSACWCVITWAPLSGERSRQGYTCPVAEFGLSPTPTQLSALTGEPSWSDVDPDRILYLDTETTNVAGGSGTYTFLIGLGRFAKNAACEPGFEVAQYFMDHWDGERALVAAAAEALNGAQALVSYNGRAYDVPLLVSRWIVQRREPCFPALHLDLLHYARKLWKLRLAGCGLGDIEAGILNLRRLSDVNGSWVPRIYFDFVRGVRVERIVPVFDHHAQDIFTLGALAALFVQACEKPEHPRYAHASDQWGLSRLCAARGEMDRAVACLEAAVLEARDEDQGFRFAMHLARLYRRLGRFEEALAIWQARVAQARPGRLEPLIELAKYAEHTLHDYGAAGVWVRRALELLSGQAEFMAALNGTLPAETSTARELAAINQRLARLIQRENRAQSRAAKQATKSTRNRKNSLNPV